MKKLITPAEVIELAFADSPGIGVEKISEAVIISAQQKFIQPVVGGLYAKLEEGDLGDLLAGYIKPALAHYVKLLVIPTLTASAGNLGIVQGKNGNFSPADDRSVGAIRRSTRSQAMSLMRRATDHIEANPTLYPEYSESDNVLKRVSISSQIVL